jgi:hypothetical protein
MNTAKAALLALLLAAPAGAVEVTVYNDNLGLVKERRTFSLKDGVNDVQATDVAAQMDATSVHFKSLTAPDAVSVLEQNFEYDLVSPEKIMEKYLGRTIALERFSGPNGEKRDVLEGTLLSTMGGRVLQSGGKVYINPPGNPVLPELPEGLLTKPTLVWKLRSTKSGSHDCEVSYLTSGMGWSADYVAVANGDDSKMDLNAWVTLNNNSGATFKDAKLKLVAGDVHRAPNRREAGRFLAKAMAMSEAAAAPQFAEKSFFEYHLYTLGRNTTLKENQTKQIELAAAANVPVRKVYTYKGAPEVWSDYGDYTRTDSSYGASSGNKKVFVTLEFKNSKGNNLGMAMPAGRVRVYKADSDGSLLLIGEDALDHTPKDEEVRLKIGDAFDIVGERKRMNFQVDSKKRWAEETFEIKLRNHKDQDVTVAVIEPLYRWTGWKITEASQKWTKKDAQTIRFDVPVQKDGESTVSYTVRYSW